jgi:hypothetical protein
VGVSPRKLTRGTRFFATVPFVAEPERHLSIFVSFDDEEMIDLSGSIRAVDLVQAVVHAPSPSDPKSRHASTLLPRGLQQLAEADDDLLDDEGVKVIRPGYKLGGRPHCIHDPIEDIDGGRELLSKGFVQAAQLDAFGLAADADLEGEHPFGDGMLHVFVRNPLGDVEWRWLWEL